MNTFIYIFLLTSRLEAILTYHQSTISLGKTPKKTPLIFLFSFAQWVHMEDFPWEKFRQVALRFRVFNSNDIFMSRMTVKL